jgi:hypothetical protein
VKSQLAIIESQNISSVLPSDDEQILPSNTRRNVTTLTSESATEEDKLTSKDGDNKGKLFMFIDINIFIIQITSVSTNKTASSVQLRTPHDVFN